MENVLPKINENYYMKNKSNNLSEKSNLVNENIYDDNNSENPFQMPNNDDFFNYKNNEKDKLENKKWKNLKIWDKNTSSTSKPLKLYKNFGLVKEQIEKLDSNSENMNENELNKIKKKKIFSENEKNMIEKAKKILEERKQERKNHTYWDKKKETIKNVVEQRKEIFLVTMTTQIVLDEQKKLKNNIDNKEKAIKLYKNSLENDKNVFMKYFEEKKKLTQKALEEARTITLQKTELVQKIKTISQKLGNLKSENAKMEENKSNLKELKKFLNSIKPDHLKSEIDKQYELLKKSHENDFILKFKEDCKNNNKNFNENHAKKEFEDQVDKGLIKELAELEELEELNIKESKIFFTDPNQLMEIFSKKEENFLYLIQSTQELDKTLQEEKLKLKQIKEKKNNKIEKLRKQEGNLKSILDQNEQEYKKLIKKLDENKINNEFKDFNKIEDYIYEIINNISDEIDKNNWGAFNKKEIKNKKNILRYLGEIDKYINNQMYLWANNKDLIDKKNIPANRNRNFNANSESMKNKKLQKLKVLEKIKKMQEKPVLEKRRKEMKKYHIKIVSKNQKIKEVIDDEEENKNFFEI